MLDHNQDIVTNEITQLNEITEGKDQNKSLGIACIEKREMEQEGRKQEKGKKQWHMNQI